jgi:hypothetical protein
MHVPTSGEENRIGAQEGHRYPGSGVFFWRGENGGGGNDGEGSLSAG